MTSISLKVFITPFADKGSEEAAKWSCDSANEALKQVNTIWQKANVGFVINDCIMDRPLDMEKGSRNDDKRLLGVLSLRHDTDSFVHIYLVNAIENLIAGGGSYLNSDPEPASFVQWYGNPLANGRALAHELGHLMSLDHMKIDYMHAKQAALLRNNLMVEGMISGDDLTPKQISNVKGSKLVKQFGG
jgi:hypothetical protein